MSEKSYNITKQKREHRTTTSYVVGFILSLIFTAIPYYMVVHKTVTGSSLLATILAFAVLQMLIQIFFFLHLGRGPKPLYNVVFFVSTAGIILVVVLGSIFIIDHLNYNMMAKDVTTKLSQDEGIAQVGGEKTGACNDIGTSHKVTIRDGKVTPFNVNAKLCDSLTFINEDSRVRDIAFGPHPSHLVYGGEIEVTVRKGYPKTITLNQTTRQMIFHDHHDPSTFGTFSVKP